jgi:hypothetical protein
VLNMTIDLSGEKPKSSACFRTLPTKCALKTEPYGAAFQSVSDSRQNRWLFWTTAFMTGVRSRLQTSRRHVCRQTTRDNKAMELPRNGRPPSRRPSRHLHLLNLMSALSTSGLSQILFTILLLLM